MSRRVVRAGKAMRQRQQTRGRGAAGQLQTQPRARGTWVPWEEGGFHKGPFLVHSLLSLILSKLFVAADDAADYENSTAIHTWKAQRGEGTFSAAVCCVGMALVGRVPVALDHARGRAAISPV